MNEPIILQYKDPQSLLDGRLYYAGPVLTAQKRMAQLYRENHHWAYDINSVLEELLPDWYSRMRLLQQYLLTSQLIDEEKSNYSATLINSFSHNRSDLIKSFRTLAEIGIPAEQLNCELDEQGLFKRLYQKFSLSEASGVELLYQKLALWKKSEFFSLILKEKKIGDFSPIGKPKALYFQGFYYIRPMQNRLIQAIRDLGIKVYFLNAFDEKHSLQYEIWSKNPHFSKNWEVRLIDSEKAVSYHDPNLRQYEDLFSMVRDLRKVDNKIHVFAPLDKNAREIFETFFPKDTQKSRLLSYPIGRYLWGLYSMWDERTQNIVLNNDIVAQCLSTGWANEQYCSNTEVLRTFQRVREYFSDCKTLDDWEDRSSHLTEVTQNILPLFKTSDETSDETNFDKRWLSAVSSPFVTISAFNVPYSDLEALIKTLRQMIADAQYLFNIENEKIKIVEHFKRLKSMLNNKTNKVHVIEEEKEILAKLLSRLSTNPDIEECPVIHLADAMVFFLGGKRNETQIDLSEEEYLSEISGITELEASLLKPDYPILLCYCDANTLPGKPRELSWPLTPQYFSKLELEKDTQQRLSDYLYFINSSLLSNRYLFHIAHSHPNLTVSWVSNQSDKIVPPSIYVKLENSYPKSVQYIQGLLLDDTNAEGVEPIMTDVELQKKLDEYLQSKPELPLEVKSAQKICPRKNLKVLFDYFVANKPEFCSAFHMRFLFSILISIIADHQGCSTEQAAREVFSLYPSFAESEKQEMLEFAGFNKKKLINQFGKEALNFGNNIKRLYLHYLNISKVNQLLCNDSGIQLTKDSCIYCPHSSICPINLGTRHD